MRREEKRREGIRGERREKERKIVKERGKEK